MKHISRKQFEKAVEIIETYTKQQEVYFKQSKNLLDKINLFYVNENDLIFDDLSVRDINALKSSEDVLIHNLTIKEFAEKYSINDICKFRNVGRKTIENVKERILMAGLKWK